MSSKDIIYCVGIGSYIEESPNIDAHVTYSVTKIDDDAESSLYGYQGYDVMHNLSNETWNCNCPGFLHHNSATARSPNKHKHFLLCKAYEQVIKDKYEGKHPVAGLYLKIDRHGDITEVPNPMQLDEGIDDVFTSASK